MKNSYAKEEERGKKRDSRYSWYFLCTNVCGVWCVVHIDHSSEKNNWEDKEEREREILLFSYLHFAVFIKCTNLSIVECVRFSCIALVLLAFPFWFMIAHCLVYLLILRWTSKMSLTFVQSMWIYFYPFSSANMLNIWIINRESINAKR